jgi:hypothetical protein
MYFNGTVGDRWHAAPVDVRSNGITVEWYGVCMQRSAPGSDAVSCYINVQRGTGE